MRAKNAIVCVCCEHGISDLFIIIRSFNCSFNLIIYYFFIKSIFFFAMNLNSNALFLSLDFCKCVTTKKYFKVVNNLDNTVCNC